MHRAITFGIVTGLAPIAMGGVVTLDFETEDDLVTPLVNGQHIASPQEFGNLVNISGFGANNLGAAIFDSSPAGPNVGGQDPDLLVGLGNILIFQSPDEPMQTVPGVFDTPNDALLGGTFVFDFNDPVEMRELTIIDIDADNHTVVTMLDGSGRMRLYDVPEGWSKDIHAQGPDGYDTLDLTSLAPQLGEGGETATAFEDAGFDANDVRFVSVEMSGSGGIDNFSFRVIPTPGSATLLLVGAGLAAVRRRRG